MTQSTEQERAEFEAWAAKNYHGINLEHEGRSYRYSLANEWWTAWKAARRAPAVTDTRARYSGSIQELKQYASEDVDAMVHICNKQIGNVPKGFFLAMQECAALVGRAPAAPVPDVTDAMIEAANEAYCPFGDMQLAIQAALAAAPQPTEAAQLDDTNVADMAQAVDSKEAAPVQMPEPAAWRYTDARGHYRYRGARPGFAVEYQLLKPEALYTEQQVRRLLNAAEAGNGK